MVVLALLIGLVEVILLMVWQRDSSWGAGNGVYALSAREFLHGLLPYHDFAAAQPPPILLVGAGLLALSDTAMSLRVGLALVDMATAVLVGVCVWRLERRAWLALAAGAFAPLLPISLNGHAQLVPETLAAPLVLGGALSCANKDRSLVGGLLLAVTVWCKVAFLIPAVAIILVAPARARALAALLAGSVALFTGSLLFFGSGMYRETVAAQLQVGRASLRYASGLVAQIGWNELPLVLGAGFFLLTFRQNRDSDEQALLVRTISAAAVGGLLLALTVFKRGSYLNVMAVADPPLLALAACGAARAWRSGAATRAVAMLLGAFLLAQSASLLLHPSNPWLADRPFARAGLGWTAGPAQVDQAVRLARRCPANEAYAGTPYIAFLANRRAPGLQPDRFIIDTAPINAAFAKRAADDRPLCR